MISTTLRVGILLALASIGLVGCDQASNTSQSSATAKDASSHPGATDHAWFQECAPQRGIDFTWRSGHRDGRYLFPESIGGGAALFDMDNDGDLDAYLVQGGSLTTPSERTSNIMLRNRGDGAFDDVTSTSGDAARPPSSPDAYGMGAACGDYDNDGDVDIYVTNVGSNVLLRNNADGTWTDVTGDAAVGHSGWGASAAFLDYDRDGDLDLFSCNYLNWSSATEQGCYNNMGAPDYCSPNNYSAPAMDVLYRNDGPPNYTFTDVTIHAGLDAYFGNGLGVVCGDFNGDAWIDIFVANDGMRNQLWVNRRDGTFMDLGLQTGCALDLEGKAKAGMGTHAADVDDDGDLDIIVCNLRRESDSVFINHGTHFSDETTRAGLRVITRSFTRFGMGWLDFDNDGWLDLYQANGLVMREDQQASDDPYAQPDLLFRGIAQKGGVFQEVQPRGGTKKLLIATSRAAAFGDIDNDGGVDVLVVNRDAPAHLLRNIAPNRGHWIMLRVLEEHARDAYGATVKLNVGGRIITRDVRAAYSYLASNDPRVHIGLGQAMKVDEVAVKWVDGTITSYGALQADRIHTLRRSGGSSGEQ
jgi:hypothetical protein